MIRVRQRLKIRQLIWVFAPGLLVGLGLLMITGAAAYGLSHKGPDPLAAGVAIFALFLVLWGAVMYAILFSERQSVKRRLKEARQDRPRLYRRRRPFRRGRQRGIRVEQHGQELCLYVSSYAPPRRDLLSDIVLLDFLGPWEQTGESELPERAYSAEEARRLLREADRQARQIERL